MNDIFFREFLMVSDLKTILLIVVLAVVFIVIARLQKKKVNFSKRMLVGTLFGLVLGLLMQWMSNFPANPLEITYINEATRWFGLIGGGFIDLIKMLVVPLVMVSIIHVLINMPSDANISKLTRNTVFISLGMVAIAALVGIGVGALFNVGSGMQVVQGEAVIKEVKKIIDTLRGLIPSNPVKAMVDLNIIALVIFSLFIALATNRMKKKYAEEVGPFIRFINAFHKIIMSVAMMIIKFMPFAVVPLLANTLATRGLESILDVGIFIIALYIALAIMLIIQAFGALLFGYNPIVYFKKSIPLMILAFTSRSSVGALPLTIETLTNKLGVNSATASFVAGYGTTAGMQGCAGVFPAMLLVFIANIQGNPMDVTFVLMSVIVITIGSLGIAGIPGTATMAASVALSGTGQAALFPLASPILAIDPIIDMGRTLVNVMGSVTNALMVDKTLGTQDIKAYHEHNQDQ